jgi:subtilisin family serine protease
VNFDSSASISNVADDYPSASLIDPHWMAAFLNSSAAASLSALRGVHLVQNTPELKAADLSETGRYILQVSPAYERSNMTQKLIGNLVSLTTNDISPFLSDPNVLSIQPMPKLKLLNRWASGRLQSGTDALDFSSSGFFESTRTVNSHSIDGTGIVVSVIDSGVSSTHPFFSDAGRPMPINQTDLEHRKVIRYDAYVDSIDTQSGHGTHAAGTVAGLARPECESLNLYRGHASGAKLHIVDIGDDTDSEYLSISIDSLTDAVEKGYDLGARIFSCSWGSEDNWVMRYIFDWLVQHNPTVLFVFAAGNEGAPHSVVSPGSAKNVLTVGSTTVLAGAAISAASSQSIRLVSTSPSFSVAVSSPNLYSVVSKDTLWKTPTLPVRAFNSGDLAGNLVLVNQASLVFDAIEGGAAGVVLGSTPDSSCGELPVPVFQATAAGMATLATASSVRIVFESTASTSISPSTFSSLGPTIPGLLKPEIYAPGEAILSAKSGPSSCSDGLVASSGTSMATPAIAGSAALVLQYIRENISELPAAPPQAACLIRAFLVQATAVDAPTAAATFFTPALDNVLVFPEDFATQGIRYFNFQIHQLQEFVCEVALNAKGNLSVTASWIDFAQEADDTYLGIIQDLDLFVVSPGGAITYGNRRLNQDTDGFSTTEKVILGTADPGTYEIHVVANPSLAGSAQVVCSLVVNGPFAQKDFTANPADLKARAGAWAAPSCGKLATGIHCQVPVIDLTSEEPVTRTIRPGETLYFHVSVPSGSDIVELDCSVRTSSSVFLRLCVVTDNQYKLQLARDRVDIQTSTAVTWTIEVDGTENLYVAFHSEMHVLAELSLSGPSESGTAWWVYALIVIGVLVVIIAVVALVCYIVGKRKARVENEGPGASEAPGSELRTPRPARTQPAEPGQSGGYGPLRPGENTHPDLYDGMAPDLYQWDPIQMLYDPQGNDRPADGYEPVARATPSDPPHPSGRLHPSDRPDGFAQPFPYARGTPSDQPHPSDPPARAVPPAGYPTEPPLPADPA